MEAVKQRKVGIDLGKREWTMAILGEDRKMKLHKGKTNVPGRQKLCQLLEAGDKVALEAGNLAFKMALEIRGQKGCEVRVLNSARLPEIWSATTKTDREDAMKLAHILDERRDDRLPLVAIPSEAEMERRKLVSSYRRETQDRTRNINRLHALFLQRGLTEVVKKDLATAAAREEKVGQLDGYEKEEARYLLLHLELTEGRLAALRKKIHAEVTADEQLEMLKTIAGVGEVTAYVYAAYVGDGSRFSRSDQVSNYLGLVPRLDYSGTIQRNGHISKRGNGYARALLVQAAWAAVRSKNGGALRERFLYLTKDKAAGKKKTIIGIARRLSIIMFAVLRDGKPYQPKAWKKTISPDTAFAGELQSG